ncbi:MAG: lipoate--protein ligase family protein [Candidatus Hydrogenedentes bacterium]|nr:lipoate--protein ligase family protein [Candidatus Hydrogenedentota bacterium]
MLWIDHSFAAPAQNLALEEVLLEQVVAGARPSLLRFWESPTPFVVLGTAQCLSTEVIETACIADGVPIMRRCSAGGCVLQGPGSLNFTLVLAIDAYPEVRGIRDSYCHIADCLRRAFATRNLALRHGGTSDITFNGKKVSGNAQRRRRNAVLHHGTLVYQPNFGGMARYLGEPADRPAYRGARTHAEFVGALPLDAEALKALARAAFGAEGAPASLFPEEIRQSEVLARDKYDTAAWIRRR